LLRVSTLRFGKRRPVGDLRRGADGARCLLEKIPTPYTILSGHRISVDERPAD
jgi:hypothetical protein